MKKTNFNLKSIVQKSARWLLTLITLLILGVGQTWAATSTTVYYAVNTSYTVKCNVNRKGDGDDWKTYTMTKTANKYNDKYIYSCSFTDLYDGLGCLQFQLYDGNTWKSQVQPISSWTGASTYNGKLYVSSWIDYRYDHTISNGATIVWDNAGNTGWSNTYLYKEVNGGSGSNSSAFTRCGSTTQWYKTYASAETKIGKLQFRANTSNWNDGTHTTDLISAGNLSDVTLFTYTNTKDGYALNWQVTTNAKKATSGTKIYFDNTDAGWGEVWFKYGTQWYNRHTGAAASEVPGTDALYVITIPNDCYYEKYVLADKYGWTGYNNITADNNISHRIAHQAANIASEITYIPTTGTGSSPKVWSFETISGGHSRTLTFGSHTNGQITVRYTDESGVEHTVSSADANTVTVAQTCKVIITAVPNSGFAPSTLTLGGASITSGAQQIIRANGEIAATFVAEETHNVTVSYKYSSRALHDNQVFEVGVTTPASINAEVIDGFSFSSWSNLTNVTNNTGNLTTNPISINTKVSGSDGSMTCNYTPWTCSLDIVPSEGATGHSSRTAMSYDATKKAYYINRTTTSATERYRFFINSIEYSASSNTELTIDETKVDANTNVTNYTSNKPSVYFNDGPSGSNITIWFDYENKKAWVEEQKYTVTISAGANGSVSPTSVTAGAVQASETITATADEHYHWESWTLPNSGVTIASGAGTRQITIKATASGKIVTANFAGDVYTITYKDKGGSDFSGTQTTPPTSHTYGTATTLKIPTKTGYDFGGWFTSSDCSTGQVGTTSSATLGATDYTANIILYAKWDAKTYRVTFDATTNGGTCATEYKDVTYGSTYGTLPTATKSAQQFAGWYTTASGAGSKVESTTTVSTANAHTLFARFEATYRVQVDYKCGSTTLRPSTEVHASASIIGAEITAPEILGYRFVNWTGDNATFAEATSATTTVHATAATTITANYTAVPTVYFKNNLDWDNVYVTFDAYFGEAGGATVPGQNGKPYYQMTQLGSSDIFYCPIPAECVSSWAWNIAFDNKGYSYNEETHTGTYGYFYQGEFLGRGDFDPSATMYIPYDGDTETRNSGTYYRTGCWMKYNSTDPGYTIYANTYVSGAGGTAVAGTPVLLTADVAGGFEFKGKVNFPKANYSYGFMLHKEATKNDKDLWYTNTGAIYSTTTSLPWHFYTDGASENGQRCAIHTEAVGDYEFTVSFGTGRPVVDVVYPVGEGDYRLVYKDLATWSNGAHTADWQHPSRVIKANANAEDIVSFYVSKADGANASIKLHKCTSIDGSGNPVWDKGTTVNLSGISETGIYNFKVTQNESKVATVAFDGSYTGNFYVRTDASDGGWSNYKTSGANTMTYSEYSVTHGGDFGPYSHYFMRHVNSGSNIKFCIANDYSECISDTVVDDTYAHEWIEVEANVRFMWYYGTNKIGRAYVSGSTNVSDRFLVLEGDEHLYDADGNPLTGTHQISGLAEHEMKFIDDQNWVYETTVQANPTERVKLTAKFNNKIQYFYGAEGDRTDANTHQLIGGTGDAKYKMRVVYDFKTNRLVAAWLPNGDVTTAFEIDADIMIIRKHQEDAQQITFSGSGKLTEVKTVYGAMQFNKYLLNNQSEDAGHADLGWSQYERDLFFISFPFDVKLNDVFGFGQYGKHWIIEYYDGKTRAQNGFWADSPSNWKFVTKDMKDLFTLKANEGYVLALDLDQLTMESPVWNYGVENVYLYFPSTASVYDIEATSRTIPIDQEGYQCTIKRNTPDGDRRIKDSYWHLLGVPSYANATNSTSGTWSGTVPVVADWTTSAPYVYSWDAVSNTFSAVSTTTTTFKPMQSYLAQYAKTTIKWESVNATPVPSSIAARRSVNSVSNYEFRLQLMQNDKELDHTFISLRDDEEVTSNFDFSYDLSKMLYGAFTAANNIYTFIGEEQVAGNCLPLTDETTIVPVGVKTSADGDYTFSMPNGTSGVGVTLIDGVTGERTNLALTDYTVSLEKGTYDQRFVLEISPIEHTTTAIENSEKTDAPNNVCKKLIDGVLYIIKDGKVFDARGARLQ